MTSAPSSRSRGASSRPTCTARRGSACRRRSRKRGFERKKKKIFFEGEEGRRRGAAIQPAARRPEARPAPTSNLVSTRGFPIHQQPYVAPTGAVRSGFCFVKEGDRVDVREVGRHARELRCRRVRRGAAAERALRDPRDLARRRPHLREAGNVLENRHALAEDDLVVDARRLVGPDEEVLNAP